MPITYIDSAAARSGDGSERSPKKYWDSSVDVSDGAVVLLKRGAVIELVNTVQPPGAITVQDYGDPAAAAPVGWISGNQVFATGDAVTLHGGVGLGVGNVIYGNTLIGGAPAR